MEILNLDIAKKSLKNVEVGEGVKIFDYVNAYNCSIGDYSKVGAFVEIQKGASIGKNCKISSHSFICEGVHIEDNCFIGHGVMFINDTFSDGKPAGDQSKWKKTSIGNNVSIGSNATILPVSICDDVVIGAGAVVTKNIKKKGTYVGNPAKRMKGKASSW